MDGYAESGWALAWCSGVDVEVISIGMYLSSYFLWFLSATGVVVGVELPVRAGEGADDTEVLSEETIPELEQELEAANVPPTAKQALEEEVEVSI